MGNEVIDIKHYSLDNISSQTRGDKTIWVIVLLLTLISLLAVYSSTGTLAYKSVTSTEEYLFRQVLFIISGLVIIYFAHLVNYTYYSKLAQLLFIISIPLLIGLGVTIGIMGIFQIKLNFFNMLALPTLIGMGVDDGVHLYHRYKEL